MLRLFYAIALGACLLFSTQSPADGERVIVLDDWIPGHFELAVKKMLANISPEGAARGAVVASPSKTSPNYFRHWIRDAAIVMDVVVSLYMRASGAKKSYYYGLLIDYVTFSLANQETVGENLGEPLLDPNGYPLYVHNEEGHGVLDQEGRPLILGWGRPQDDGPALRAITLNRLLRVLLSEGKSEYVPTIRQIIQKDLLYTLEAQGPHYDLWEEELGFSFYTRMVQRRALLEAYRAVLKQPIPDFWNKCRRRGHQLEGMILAHWDPVKNYFISTVSKSVTEGVQTKDGLDSSVILGMLHGDMNDGFLPLYDPRVMRTAYELEKQARAEFEVNWAKPHIPGTAMGRGPGDSWNGFIRTTHGHAWVLVTNYFAQYYSTMERRIRGVGHFPVTEINLPALQDLFKGYRVELMPGENIGYEHPFFRTALDQMRFKADSFLERVAYHSDPEQGTFTELLDQWHGVRTGTEDLSWSCASFITAVWERQLRTQGVRPRKSDPLPLIPTRRAG